jgi:hypothetical protein
MAQTLSVGCKLPHGINMDIEGKRVTLAGTNSSLVIGGHGITENVDKEFFDKWMDMHKESPMVKDGYIFANEKTNNVKAEATEKAKRKNGFEGIDPDNPGKGIKPDAAA